MSSIGRPREQDEISVRVPNDKVASVPRFLLEVLEKIDARRLELLKERLDLRRCGDGDRRRQQLLPLSDVANKDGLAHKPKTQSCAISLYQPKKWGFSISEFDLKPQF